MATESTIGLEDLPKGCIAHILSRTTPLDVGRFSLVSKTFYSASESDTVWDHFLPPDINSIISRSDPESDLLANPPSKKALCVALSHHPVIIDQATKSFQLDRESGKKCYMLAARALAITWGDTPRYWNWTALPESRFPEVAQLLDVCWLEIRGVINANALSPNTQYAAYLVFKMIDAYGFENHPVELSVGILGGQISTKNVCLDPNLEEEEEEEEADDDDDEEEEGEGEGRQHRRVEGLQRPNARSDGWSEIEIGEFFNSGLEDGEVEMSVCETRSGSWKCGLFLQGIEVRPKEGN